MKTFSYHRTELGETHRAKRGLLVRRRHDKYDRYRVRNIRSGRCPHCGRPCRPYYECAARRRYKRIRYRQRREAGMPAPTVRREIVRCELDGCAQQVVWYSAAATFLSPARPLPHRVKYR